MVKKKVATSRVEAVRKESALDLFMNIISEKKKIDPYHTLIKSMPKKAGPDDYVCKDCGRWFIGPQDQDFGEGGGSDETEDITEVRTPGDQPNGKPEKSSKR